MSYFHNSAILVINEVCTANVGSNDSYDDYIEFYNAGNAAISLDNLFLSDDISDPFKGSFPEGVVIEPKTFYVLYFQGQDFLPFHLSQGETILLSNDQNILDIVALDASMGGSSYGRVVDGQEDFALLHPSPGFSNEETGMVLDAPVFSVESGFFEENFMLSISSDPNFNIYYTLDGSIPDSTSYHYTSPIFISDKSKDANLASSHSDISGEVAFYTPPENAVDKGTIVRAISIDKNGNKSLDTTASYFIDLENQEAYENAQIISLVVDPKDLFSSEEGIYVRGSIYDDAIEAGTILPNATWSELIDYTNYNQRGRDWERTANISFFNSEKDLTSTQTCGIRIRGNVSRSYAQKSFSLFARNAYGEPFFDTSIFGSEIAYSSLILSGTHDMAKYLVGDFATDLSISTQDYELYQVFLNGEYWGLYSLAEKYNEDYLDGHYDMEEENALLISNTRTLELGDDISSFQELRELLTLDMTDSTLYESVNSTMSMESFIDWMCVNIYVGNTDSKPFGSNVFTFKSNEVTSSPYSDGLWRFMLYDTDDAFNTGIDFIEGRQSYMIDSFVEHPGYSPSGFLEDTPMDTLIENEEFRSLFIERFLEIATINFNPELTTSYLTDFMVEVSPWARKSYERWASDTGFSNESFEEQLTEMITFFENRADYIIPYLYEHFE